jgi:SAM-dependent methyltransferase
MKDLITDNIDLLSPLTLQQREYFAFKTGTMVLYIGDEVAAVQKAEEDAALSAAPAGHNLARLIGLNIGCGDRTISPYLLPVDIMREHNLGTGAGEHARLMSSAFLALSDDLPFKENSIDYIVALHMLEHVEDPVATVHHWLDVIKPGGGIGIVVPDWRYTWDSRKDDAPHSHKWNPTPDIGRRLYVEHWKGRCDLERIASYPFRLSFDIVLRKHGQFVPFAPPDAKIIRSGRKRFEQGIFLHSD